MNKGVHKVMKWGKVNEVDKVEGVNEGSGWDS